MSELAKADYPIGPGDVLKISVIGVQQLEDQEARVSGDGTIALPFVGSFAVAGMTQEELSRELTSRLKVYIRDPRLSIFVKSYASRTMAIMGQVEKPGKYVLISPSESILQVLGQAGGTTSDASEHVLLVPAERHTVRADTIQDRAGDCSIAADDPDGAAGASAKAGCTEQAVYRPSAPLEANSTPIEIDLNNPDDRACLSVPARPGDLVIIPQAGEVEVAGWVQRPGSVKVQPGMTVLGAISAVGGTVFSNKVELLKTDPDGHRTQTSLDLADVQQGRAVDIPVRSGDVIYVKGSAVAAVPYALEQLFQRFGTGMAIPLPVP